MARINLLPWREQLREERRKRFIATLGGVLVVAAGSVFLASQYLDSAIERQNARNDFIRKEIAVLDARIKEIAELKARREQLLERMKIIQDLQGNRPVTARVFDQLVRTLPEGVWFRSLKMTGKDISVVGLAGSNNQVSSLTRSLDASDWLESPNLNEVKASSQVAGDGGSQFQLIVKQTRPGVAEEQGGKP